MVWLDRLAATKCGRVCQYGNDSDRPIRTSCVILQCLKATLDLSDLAFDLDRFSKMKKKGTIMTSCWIIQVRL